MTEFDSIVLKLRILEASIEADELCDVVRSPQTRARLLKIRDTLDDALDVLRKYASDAHPAIPGLQGMSAAQRPDA
ncbi:hypothetical protein [Burkholderia pseudomallei]|uniref:hypothetical protein n=1 Tax=Burkholderia pseudomallei TaxID=28450 RepID=UPI00050EA94A|nr:hypothetical protein [Burkholderia pseudomallei]KGC45675.1 hypothetical protein DO65_961 [Burkholderia pseudomallei]MBF4067344.1 hypothetical protein [Burkholderia pseudomallei]MBF4087024.1 hypothetical protein [Burkholderia pseudomallei]OMS31258.1 hypothetical protein AQ739_07560 [Burkholderia pseudomallei]ONA04260.1 hypothetical protein AQ876_21005 [Burkholderia pseudomallei]